MKSDLVDIACEVVARTEKAIAITDGTPEWISPSGRTRLKWFWLPLSQVQENADGTVTVPEWLALEKGLI